MTLAHFLDGIASGRLTPDQYADNFSDIHPLLEHHEALVESDRCYFCYDAPCMRACPTSIDIPLFIRQISTGNPLGAARTIFDQNILGGMCARVCPTETLCEEVCVRETSEGRAVQIGRLQRYATDAAINRNKQFYERAASTGKRVAIVGAGPAGLSAAHRLSLHGHEVTILEARPRSGGLNEYGIAAYKASGDFARLEVDYVTGLGGITIENGKMLGRDFQLDDLTRDYDAVFLGVGLGGVNLLDTDGDDVDGVFDAVDFISVLRQTRDLAALPVGRRVVVIGGGMTAIDAAIQSKLLGAEQVTICYRRGRENMSASAWEQELAMANGVVIRHWMQPRRIIADGDTVRAVEFEYKPRNGGATSSEVVTLLADHVFRAIGQTFLQETVKNDEAAIALENGRIKVDAEGRTSMSRVWAGGDCVPGGDDLTVSAVAQGRDAAESIHRTLMG